MVAYNGWMGAYHVPDVAPALSQMVEASDDFRKKREDRAVGEAAATGKLSDAAGVAFKQGNVKTGLALKDLDDDRRQKVLDVIGRAAMSADTPEKWTKLQETVARRFPDAEPLESFEEREGLVSMYRDPYKEQDLDLKRRALALKAAEGSGSGGVGELGLNPQYGVDADGNPVLLQLSKGGKVVQSQIPEGISLSKEPIRLDAGTHFVILDPITRQPIGQVPKDVAGEERSKVEGRHAGEVSVGAPQAKSALDTGVSALRRLKTTATRIRDHEGTPGILGFKGMFPNKPGGDAADAQAQLDVLKSQVAFGVLQAMREASKTGGALGNVSDKESERLENNLAALARAQSYPAFKKAMDDIVSYADEAEQRMTSAFDQTYGSRPKQQDAADPLGLR